MNYAPATKEWLYDPTSRRWYCLEHPLTVRCEPPESEDDCEQ